MHEKRKTMRAEVTVQIKPMPFWQSLILFGVPALLAVLCQYFLWPFLIGVGISEESAYHFQALVVFMFLLIASLVAYVVEGNSLDWSSFKDRFRLSKMSGREWKWTFGGIIAQALLSLVANLLALQLYGLLDFHPPEIFPSGPMTNFPLLSQHGRYTWAIHGVLWAFFHAFKWWAVPFMLFTTWIIPLITQRVGNTTPGIIIHLVINSLGILLMA